MIGDNFYSFEFYVGEDWSIEVQEFIDGVAQDFSGATFAGGITKGNNRHTFSMEVDPNDTTILVIALVAAETSGIAPDEYNASARVSYPDGREANLFSGRCTVRLQWF